ncbi:MAG: UDP-3-O-acyl-N-acetylglucosamine deacetylase [Candidatus Margulisiibacteriota bacterium]
MKQKTIARSFSLSGIGLHSGKPTSIKVNTAPENHGIVFIQEGKKVPARIESVRETRRGTFLEGIAVTEHFLAAASGLGIDNLMVEVKGEELPALDGSALPYVEALAQAGRLEQNAEKHFISLAETIELHAGDASLSVSPGDGLEIKFMVEFPVIGVQRMTFSLSDAAFKREIAPARTLGFMEEYEKLKKQGLALGASLENALVIGQDGYLNAPRFPDEVVRHKILDLLGDLALLGRPLKASITAVKSGHQLNIALVRRLLENDRT